MTDATPDPDELVSAYVDGEATPDERRAVEADPELLARARLFQTLGQRVAAPVAPPPAGHRDAAIAAALEASPTVTETVRSLDVARARRRSPRVIAIASVAAVVALVLLVVPIVLDSGGDEVDFASEEIADEASAELPTGEEIQAADAAGGEAVEESAERDLPAEAPSLATEAPADEASAEPAPAEAALDEEPAPDAEAGFADDDAGGDTIESRTVVGAFDDAEALAAATRELVTDADRDAAAPEPTVCPDSIAEAVDVVDVVLEVDGTLDGDAVVAVVVRVTDVDGLTIEQTVVVESSTCEIVLVSDG